MVVDGGGLLPHLRVHGNPYDGLVVYGVWRSQGLSHLHVQHCAAERELLSIELLLLHLALQLGNHLLILLEITLSYTIHHHSTDVDV